MTAVEKPVDIAERRHRRDRAELRAAQRAKAARLLNTTERIINYQVRKYSIDYRRFKN